MTTVQEIEEFCGYAALLVESEPTAFSLGDLLDRWEKRPNGHSERVEQLVEQMPFSNDDTVPLETVLSAARNEFGLRDR